ncbi:MAG: hypothetical protein ACOY40_13265 [Bacillota bacterium]
MDDNAKNNESQYLLAALIEIYRGNPVYLPEFDPEMETSLLRDVFSAAISFARFDESRLVLSEEINKSYREGATVRGQIDLARTQSPDVLNAKMVAAAHVFKIMSGSRLKFS